MTAVLACLLLAAAAALLADSSAARLRRVQPGRLRTGRAARWSGWHRAVAVLRRPAVAGPAAAGAGLLAAGPAGGVVAAATAGVAAWRLQRRRAARAGADTVAEAARAVHAFAAELRAGRSPVDAVTAVAATAPARVAAPLAAAAGAIRLGADPASALRDHAAEVPAVARLAQCWRVATRSGAGLADVADALAAELKAQQRRAGDVAVEVAASRATATLLAGLPLIGIALGASLGARPLHFLLHTPAGAAVLGVGMAFEVAGVLWTDRMIQSVEQRL